MPSVAISVNRIINQKTFVIIAGYQKYKAGK